MTETIIFAASIIAVAIGWSTLNTYDYHTDLRNIAYQLSRIADALNRAQYGITPEQVWFVYDVGAYDNAYAYGEMQGFQMRKDGTIRKVGRA